jgi:hypothetical protein
LALTLAALPVHAVESASYTAYAQGKYLTALKLAEQAARFAELGADFVAPPLRIWREDDPLSLIGEIDNAVRQVRRAA